MQVKITLILKRLTGEIWIQDLLNTKLEWYLLKSNIWSSNEDITALLNIFSEPDTVQYSKHHKDSAGMVL
jgi:hypothetical protein